MLAGEEQVDSLRLGRFDYYGGGQEGDHIESSNTAATFLRLCILSRHLTPEVGSVPNLTGVS